MSIPKRHAHIMLTQLNVKERLKAYGTRVDEAMLKDSSNYTIGKHLCQGIKRKCHTTNDKSLTILSVSKIKNRLYNKIMGMRRQKTSKVIHRWRRNKFANSIYWCNDIVMVNRHQGKQICSSIWHPRNILTFWHEWQHTHAMWRYNIWNDRKIGPKNIQKAHMV